MQKSLKMKNFREFLRVRENTAMELGSAVMPSKELGSHERENLGAYLRLMRTALSVAPGRVKSFIKGLALSHPELQSELDAMNKEELNGPGAILDAARRGANKAPDIIAQNSTDEPAEM